MTKKISIKKLQEQSEEYLNGWKRAMADYENFKKQSEKEKQEFTKFANLNLIISLIPVYNNLKLALEHATGDEWSKGIEHIQKQFKQILEQNGIEEVFPKVNEKFNPEEHEAVVETGFVGTGFKPVQNKNNNKISKIISCGYKLNGKIFIPAKVTVK